MNQSALSRILGSLFARPSYDLVGSAAVGGRQHVRATLGGRVRRIRTGGRVYGRNGARACERRRRQIARGILRVTAKG